MNISIYMPVILVQIFLWLCVSCSVTGSLLLLGGWLHALIKQRHMYWYAIGLLAIRSTKIPGWSYDMVAKFARELKKENPVLFKRVQKIFREEEPAVNAPIPPVTNGCGCRQCRKARVPDILSNAVFIVCEVCGNKRCPHATDHQLPCTGSNEPGQEGSVFK